MATSRTKKKPKPRWKPRRLPPDLPPLDPAEEAKLDEFVRKSLEPYPPEQRQGTPRELHNYREYKRCEALYPGEHVVYRDYWSGRPDTSTLLRRVVLFHDKDWRKASEFAEQLPPDVRMICNGTYVDEPNATYIGGMRYEWTNSD